MRGLLLFFVGFGYGFVELFACVAVAFAFTGPSPGALAILALPAVLLAALPWPALAGTLACLLWASTGGFGGMPLAAAVTAATWAGVRGAARLWRWGRDGGARRSGQC